MGTMSSHITSLTIVYSTVYSGADQRKHKDSASFAFVWGIHRWPVHSPHKWPVTRKMFPFDDVIVKIRSPGRDINLQYNQYWDGCWLIDAWHGPTFTKSYLQFISWQLGVLVQWLITIPVCTIDLTSLVIFHWCVKKVSALRPLVHTYIHIFIYYADDTYVYVCVRACECVL